MGLFTRYGIYFIHGIIAAFIVFMFLLIYQSKQESKLFKSPIAEDNSTNILGEETPTLTPTEEIIPSETEKGKDSQNLSGKIIYVSPQGNDGKSGDSEDQALKSIQKAVDLAQPGENIYLMNGTYLQDVVSKRSGASGKPILIKGEKEAVIKGGGNARVFEINHDYLTLEGFTIDGLYGGGGNVKDYRDKLIYVIGKKVGQGVTGLKLLSLNLKNSGGECIRLRYFAHNNEVAYNTITNCGAYDFKFNQGGKNGEGIYIGTAPEQLDDGKNPTKQRDQSNNNRIHHNTIDTQGNECVDIKEGSSGNIVEYNNCTGQKDPESGGMDSRGSKNIFRYNQIKGNRGAGIRLGGDEDNDGIENEVYGNIITNNAGTTAK